MKSLVTILSLVFLAGPAMAEGPLMECTASRSIPLTDQLGFEVEVEKKIMINSSLQKIVSHELGKSTVKTYLRPDGLFSLVLIDPEIDGSSSTMGNAKGGSASLSLNGGGISVFVKCDVI